MKINFILVITLSLFVAGCIKDNTEVPPIVCDCPPQAQLIGTDSTMSGSHLGLEINAKSENVYTSLQKLRDTIDLQYVNIVGNIFTDVNQLQERIPLYQSIFLDEQKGTDSGVQISFKENKVSNIFLNSGRKLTQWPSSGIAGTVIKNGDDVNSLYVKLVKINQLSAYRNKFERISMFTKDLFTKYDPILNESPGWYFAYSFGDKRMDVIDLDFEKGQLVKIKIRHYKSY